MGMGEDQSRDGGRPWVVDEVVRAADLDLFGRSLLPAKLLLEQMPVPTSDSRHISGCSENLNVCLHG
jgi:hypothetical protein